MGRLRDERGDAGIYFLGVMLVWVVLALATAYAVIHQVGVARAQMSGDLKIALRQAANQLSAVDPVTGTQGDVQSTVQTLVADDLQAVVPSQWSYSLVDAQLFPSSDTGATPSSLGASWCQIPGGVIPGPGICAAVTLQWPIPVPVVALVKTVKIDVPEWMSANVFVQPTVNF